jgi:hypothetical protein
MKKTMFLFAIILAAVLFGTSCVSDNLDGNPKRPVLERGFFLDLSVENSSLGLRSTNVPAEPGESDVNSLHLLFFEADGSRNFIEYYDASPVSTDPYSAPAPLNMSNPVKVEFAATSQLNASTPYKILIVANIEGYVADVDVWLAGFQGMRYDIALETALNLLTEEVSAISQSDLLMSTAVDKSASGDVVNATLVRTFARFDVSLTAQPNLFSNNNPYTLESVSVWNAAVSNGIWNREHNDYSQHTAKFYDGTVTDPNYLKGSLYAFENVSVRPERDDKNTTCLVLGINNGTVTTYYRVNVTTNSLGQQTLRRNTVYTVNVVSVLGRGAATEEDAYTSAESLLALNVKDWEMEPTGLIMRDGDDILAIPTNRITFGPNAETREYQIFSYSPNPNTQLSIPEMDLPGGVSIQLSGDILTVSVTASTSSRSGHIEVAFGNLRGVIAIEQVGQNVQFLNLSVGVSGIPAFSIHADEEWHGDVTVTSSGAWTATLYNEEFKFIRHLPGDDDAPDLFASGSSGDTFSVATADVNSGEEARYGFIIVSLDDNPDVNAVLALTQHGSPKIELLPGHREIVFEADGTPQGVVTNVFTVRTTSNLDWNVQFYGIVGHFEAIQDKINNTITVTAPFSTQSTDMLATMRVFITAMPVIHETVSIRQLPQVLILDPQSVSNVPSAGGDSESITVTSSRPWTIDIVGERWGAELLDLSGNPVTNGVNGDAFVVRFPSMPFGMVGNPVVKVRISMSGTDVFREIDIIQGIVRVRPISILSGQDRLGGTAWAGNVSAANQNPVRRLRDEFRNNTGNVNFGMEVPPATVLSGVITLQNGLSLNPTGADIYVSNGRYTAPNPGSAVNSWRTEQSNRVLLVPGMAVVAADVTARRAVMIGYTQASGGPTAATIRTIRTGTNANTNALTDYLFRSGPFTDGTTDISSQIRLRTNDVGSHLTAWPNTFIPLIMRADSGTGANQCVVGIDPVNRIVFIGGGYFGMAAPGATGTAAVNYNSNWVASNTASAANIAFVRNLAAWMVEVTQQGDEFVDRFR